MRSVSLSSLFPADVKYEKNGLKEVFLWHVEIPTKWKVYKSFSRSKHWPPSWMCSIYVTLTMQFEFHLKVRCTAWQEAWNSISSHCVTLHDKVMWHYGCWFCKNVITRTWVFVFFRICFCLSMCKVIFFSCSVVISNVFTRFINDSVSLRIEPLTVRNCSPWCRSDTVTILVP